MKLFTIPTNRLLGKEVNSIILEMDICDEDDLELLILDNGSLEVFNQNNIFLKTLNIDYPLHHIGKNKMESFIEQLSILTQRNYSTLRNLLYPNDGDYGGISNMIYLLAIYYGADSLHRRDSDCNVEGIEKSFLPVLKEKELLSKTLKTVISDLKLVEKNTLNLEDDILIVGSDYYGDYNMDFSLLKSAEGKENKAKIELFKLMGIPSEAIESQIDTKYDKNNGSENSQPLLKTSFNVPEYPDCGNISMSTIYEYLPNFSGHKGIGYDYNTYFFAFLFKVPIVYHFNKINHEYFEERKSLEEQVTYWKGIYKQVCLDNLLTYFIKNHLESILQSENTQGIKLIKIILENDKFNYSMKDSASSVLMENQVSFDKMVGLLENVGTRECRFVAQSLSNSKNIIIKEVENDFIKSTSIIEHWRALVLATQSLRKNLISAKEFL